LTLAGGQLEEEERRNIEALAAAVETALKSHDVHRLKEANAKLDEGTQHLATLLIDRAMTEARSRSRPSR
jgi:hypothetical protein